MLLPQAVTIGIVVAGLVDHAAAGWGFSGSRKAPAVPSIAPPIAPYSEQKVSLRDSMEKVKETLDSLATMPTCKKTAAKDLLHTCETFEDRKNSQHGSSDNHLETLQKLFAIRVTNCEQLDANDVLPKVCLPLLHIDHRSKDLPTMISNCLEALNSGHPNMWTTYRHVKLEGLIMCTAMRAEANKDDQIYLLEVLFGSVNNINGGLALQWDEVKALTENFRGISSQMRDFQEALLQDNEEIKAMVMEATVDLQGSLTNITDVHQVILQAMTAASDTLTKSASQMGESMELALAQSDETGAQWQAKLQAARDDFQLYQDQQVYFVQQVLDLFHTGAYNLSQSVQLANDQTSALASSLGDLSLQVAAPFEKLASLNVGADELVAKHQLMQDTSNETLQTLDATHKLAGRFFNLVEIISVYVQAMLDHMGIFSIYWAITFIPSFYLMRRYVSRGWAPVLAAMNATYLSIFCAWVHSPIKLVHSVFANHPTFFSPVYWSVLTVVVVTILSWETVKQGHRCVQLSRAESGLRLPVDEHQGVDRKI